jgi:hypothetical protein
LRPHRGISQTYLPLYLGFFEFVHNVRLELTRFGGYLILCVQGGIHNAPITSPISA